MTADPTVCVVDNDPGVLKSMRWLLESERLRVETFASGSSFLEEFDGSRPGCLILDIRMPGMSGLEVQDRLVKTGAKIPVIILSGYGDVATCTQALKSGARAFIEKPADDECLLSQIRAAIDADLDRRRIEAQRTEIASRIAWLTPRETEVMELLVRGESPKRIAAALNISIQTVAKHRARVLKKLQVGNDVELTRLTLAMKSEEAADQSFGPLTSN